VDRQRTVICLIPGRFLAFPALGGTMMGVSDPELTDRVAASTGLSPAVAARLIDDVLAWYGEPVEVFVRRRHAHYQLYGKRNRQIFGLIAAELRGRVVAPPPLTERQLRRMIYG
jgi:hypothetical protein